MRRFCAILNLSKREAQTNFTKTLSRISNQVAAKYGVNMIVVNPQIYLNTARTYVALALSLRSNYYLSMARNQLALYYIAIEKTTSVTKTYEIKLVA